MKKVILIVFFVSLVIIAMFYYNTNRVENSSNESVLNWQKGVNNKMNARKKLIIGKKLGSVQDFMNVLNMKIDSQKIIVFYYTQTDCGSCISKGFKFMNYAIDNDFFYNNNYMVISTKQNIGNDAILEKYDGPLMWDSNGIVLEEVRHFFTPFLLYLDQNYKIINIYAITSFDETAIEDIVVKLLEKT